MRGSYIPKIGYGTGDLKECDETVEKIHNAVLCGYRLIDTASAYGNESCVGDAVKRVGGIVPRSELFITSKINNERAQSSSGYYATLNAFDDTLNRLQVDYLDMYLIHWPVLRDNEKRHRELNVETWQAMEKLVNDGKVKYIGVSNFLERHLTALMESATIMPFVNQLEIHPRFQQKNLVSFCFNNNILVEAWGPLGNGKVFEIALLREIARKHGKTVSQICLRWNIQKDIIPIPKSSTVDRMKENLDVFDFELGEEDMNSINLLDTLDGHADFYSYKRAREN